MRRGKTRTLVLMRALTEAEFLSWSANHGLALDPQYPDMAVLSFRAGSGDARFGKYLRSRSDAHTSSHHCWNFSVTGDPALLGAISVAGLRSIISILSASMT
jgi:hypothetical protein